MADNDTGLRQLDDTGKELMQTAERELTAAINALHEAQNALLKLKGLGSELANSEFSKAFQMLSNARVAVKDAK